MNEPIPIKAVMIRSLETQIRATIIEIDELIEIRASWNRIESLMDTRDELTKMLEKLKSTQ